MTLPLARVARHEAGHAVVALARRGVVVWSYATTEGGLTRWGAAANEIWPYKAAAVAMAGALADGHAIPPSDARHLAGLRLEADELAAIERRTIALVELYAPAIEAVAAGLLARGRLSGLAIKRAALRASPELRAIVIPLSHEHMQAPPIIGAVT